MSAKHIKIFCKLPTYIKQEDSDFYSIFSDLCIEHYLRPAHGTSGITFLFPKEKSYRKDIINAAYSEHPEKAIEMIGALVIKDYLKSPSSFGSNVTNLLNQKLEIKKTDDKHVELANGLKLTLDPKFKTSAQRSNMAVYIISGSGKIPTNGPAAAKKEEGQKASSMSGGSGYNDKKALHELLEKKYEGEIMKEDNIYVKKVYLQLKYLSEYKGSAELFEYLGNDEFSDSYLLDMYCAEKNVECFTLLLKVLNDSRADKITKDVYTKEKKEFCKASASESFYKDTSRLSSIRSPIDFRTAIFSLYNNDKKKAAKDLFIVFCNICRDLWQTEVSGEQAAIFKNFAYLASNVYTCCLDILSKEFDIARDLTLYGNLLKSDIFMFNPKQVFLPSGYSSKSLPSPLSMEFFSLTDVINHPSTLKKGGDSECDALFRDLESIPESMPEPMPQLVSETPALLDSSEGQEFA